MFNSPIAYCSIKRTWVTLEQNQSDCERRNLCDGAAPCPISMWFSKPLAHRIALSIVGADVRAARTVRSALELIGGVESVVLSHDCRRAAVTYDPSKVDTQQFIRALRAVGFDGNEDKTLQFDDWRSAAAMRVIEFDPNQKDGRQIGEDGASVPG